MIYGIVMSSYVILLKIMHISEFKFCARVEFGVINSPIIDPVG